MNSDPITAKYRIVLVEDDTRLSEYIAEYLEEEGFEVTVVADGTQAISVIIDNNPDLVVLDIMLPGTDGVEVCRKVRKLYVNPIIMLTAAGNDLVEVSSLNSGADSYLNKPIKPQVLLAHIEAALRRSNKVGDELTTTQLIAQDVVVDSSKMQTTINGTDVDLTSGEFELIWVLVEMAGTIVSRDELYQRTRGIDHDGLDRSIDLRISQLRKKLNDESPPYKYIKTVRNKGYLFVI